ncbi:uncharacterized protein LOC111862315, partial [Cryptotermes secundus]|uniref:uncharacterized protein LOC111862315 n=1 Tax=Cryptotermes secundus TaxID=105785 RepID=UPI000CD7B4D1
MFVFRMSQSIRLSCPFSSIISSLLIATILTAGGADGLEINPVTTVLPLVIRNGTVNNVVLDCDYALNDDDYATNEKNPGALVVKWFFNNDPAPVYQWIHSKKPQGLGVLNGKLNLEYRISDDNATMYRALQIINPTTELSGEYKCTVSTFDDERSQTRKMIIYVPEKSLVLTQTKLKEHKAVNITCKAEGVFPEPELAIHSTERPGTHDIQFETIPRNGVFDAVASVIVNDSDLEDSTKFECELKIPETNYTVKKTVTLTLGPPTTTTPEPSSTTELVPAANPNV